MKKQDDYGRQMMKQFRTSVKRFSTSGKAAEDITLNSVGSRPKGLELDLRLREFEISQLTQRNNFFMIFQGVMIAGLLQSQGTAAPVITFFTSLLGVATSLFQIGMAGGAKYWQSRWEASTRSSEIAIVLELLKQRKMAVQTFTHDSKVLSEFERNQIEKWNLEHSIEEKIVNDDKYIQQVVEADIEAGKSRPIRGWLDWWVREYAIKPKWSVSRIPIWVGASLLLFWTVLVLNSFHIRGVNASAPGWWPIELVPLKIESNKSSDGNQQKK